ncbi:MAG: hypothetical protein ACLUTF_03325 [Anaerostipes hadrus]
MQHDDTQTNTGRTRNQPHRTQRYRRQKKETSTKKTKDTKKSSKKKDTKSKKTDQEKVVPMPTQVVSKTSSSAIQSRISAKEAKITKLEKKIQNFQPDTTGNEKAAKLSKHFIRNIQQVPRQRSHYMDRKLRLRSKYQKR